MKNEKNVIFIFSRAAVYLPKYMQNLNHDYPLFQEVPSANVVLRKFMVYLTKLCKNCSGMFDSNDCYDGHLRSGVCNTAFICETCRGWVSSPDVVHVCLGDKCIYCRKSVDLNHVCYITRLDKSLTQSKEWRYIFYDFESTQDEIDPETGLNIHKVNFAVAMVVYPLCLSTWRVLS